MITGVVRWLQFLVLVHGPSREVAVRDVDARLEAVRRACQEAQFTPIPPLPSSHRRRAHG